MDLTGKLNQDAYYATLDYDVNGDESVGAETAIKVRWQKDRLVERLEDGEEHLRHEGIFWAETAIPNGALFWPPGADQTDDGEAYTVRRHRQSPSIDASQILYRHEVV